jgi:hypothetical protein
MAAMASRSILINPTVSTTIPGMRKVRHVESNMTASDRGPIPAKLRAELHQHRGDRTPTWWSQEEAAIGRIASRWDGFSFQLTGRW